VKRPHWLKPRRLVVLQGKTVSAGGVEIERFYEVYRTRFRRRPKVTREWVVISGEKPAEGQGLPRPRPH